MGFLLSLFGFQQAGRGPIADGPLGNLIQDAAITLHLPKQPQYVQIPDPNNPGQTIQVEPSGSRVGRYARFFLGLIGYVNTSIGNDTDRVHTAADGPLGNGTQFIPEFGYSGLGEQRWPEIPARPPGAPPPPPGPGTPPGGGFPGATYVGRVERANPYRI